MSIAIIAGLGNPGPKYRNTRHNVGFALIDQFAAKHGAVWKTEARFAAETAVVEYSRRKLMLIKPQTYMNSSGRSLSAVLRYRRLAPESLLVIYDDITLDVARSKLSHHGSAGGHNGITDLLGQVGPGFSRYRVGIGTKPHKQMDLADHVLSKFSQDEQQLLADRMPTYLEHFTLIIDSGIEPAMNLINQRTANERNDNE